MNLFAWTAGPLAHFHSAPGLSLETLLMLNIDDLLNGLPRELTLRFFATFSRFEFALKQCGCLQRAKEGDVAEASRRKLEKRLSPEFFQRVRDSGVANMLIERPARNLFVQAQGPPQFGEPERPITTTRELLDAVWRVRNNLFHGNKLYPADRNRDQDLMTNVLAVIDAIIKEDDCISGAFHDPQQFF